MGLYRGAYNLWGPYNWNILDGTIYMGAYIHGGLKLEYYFGFIAGGGVLTGTLMCDFIVWFTEKITCRVGLAM